MKITDAIIRVVDCETTGLDPTEHKVIEIACVDMTYSKGIADSISSFINPEREIPLSSMAVHHITNEMVKDAPTIDAIWPSLRDGRGAFDALAAHNTKFDFSFLKTTSPTLCSFRLARHLWPNLESHSNQYLRYYLKVDVAPEVPMHRALGDATVTALTLQKMLKVVVEEKGVNDLDALTKLVEQPLLLGTCRFGKHNGQKWFDIPIDYLRWMKENRVRMDDIDIAHTVDYYLQQSLVK
jgi:exodeoxyribonuclease X